MIYAPSCVNISAQNILLFADDIKVFCGRHRLAY